MLRLTDTRSRVLLSLFVIALLPSCAPTLILAADHGPAVTDDDRLRVMTYNLRYADAQGPNAWSNRLSRMVFLIAEVNPDLIGTQEGLFEQLKDLALACPAYDRIGLGRDGGSHGEFMAIFYRKARFEPLEYDHFWLSDTPSVIGSATWGHSNRRMVTWVRFRDQRTGRQFYHFNTHLDHSNQEAREKAAALIRNRVVGLSTKLPILLTGDFNAVGGDNKAYDTLVPEPFRDTWFLAARREGEGFGTFNGFTQTPTDNRRIDWILLRGQAEVMTSMIITNSVNGQFPSDHFPVVTDLRLTE